MKETVRFLSLQNKLFDMKVDYKDLNFERLGHSSVKISGNSTPVIYIDPWSNVIEDSPEDADYVLVTHDDFDHYDPEGIEKVSNNDTHIVIYEGVDTSDLELPHSLIGVNEEGEFDGFNLETKPAYNLGSGDHVDEKGDPWHAEGEVIGLVLKIDGVSVFYPSDTDYLDLHDEITADVLIPPIGGHYTMDRHEAAKLAESLQPELVLPVHYDTFEPIEADEKSFKKELEEKGIKTVLF